MKKLVSIFAIMCMMMCCITVASAADRTYTFSGTNIVKSAGTEDVENVKLTNDISVTTGGPMNWKVAAVTDAAHNNECGFYPIGGGFNPTGSYIFLMTGNTNKDTTFVLHMPAIPAGSEVTITFAKPIVTNNGGTRRNENDPYAYFNIGDRNISINGSEFDTWHTASVVTGRETDRILFNCDEWGAVAIQKIEIKENVNTPLHTLNVKTTQYANLMINGIRYYATGLGDLNSPPSFAEGEKVTIIAKKDGYADAETTVTIGNEDVTAEFYPECEKNAVYYESDFGVSSGKLELGSYLLGIEAKPVTRFFGEVTFTENGILSLSGDNGEIVTLSKKDDGIYANETFITAKDNMEFEIIFDQEVGIATLTQNGVSTVIDEGLRKFRKINYLRDIDSYSEIVEKYSPFEPKITMDYLGISYPDMSNITIEGPDTVVSFADWGTNTAEYKAVLEYDKNISNDWLLNGETVPEKGTAKGQRWARVYIPSGMSGTARLEFKYGDYTAYKDINVVTNPKLELTHEGKTLNLYGRKKFTVSAVDEYGNDVSGIVNSIILKDFKSSNEDAIKIDENGIMSAVGVGTATITANAYTGVDNIISVNYTVERYAIEGTTATTATNGAAGGAGVAYEPNDLVTDEHITGYKLICGDEESYIEPTEIPAATVEKDGFVVTAVYSQSGSLGYSKLREVKAGDKTEISSGRKTVYFYADGNFEKLTEADTTIEGFEVNGAPNSYYTISPVYTFTDIGDVSEGKTLDATFGNGYYDITFKKAETWRGDILVNGYMVGNNVDQADADRKVIDGALYTAERINIDNGEINVSMTDGSTLLDYVTVERSSKIYSRIFIIGDSLACEYYGEFEQEVGGGRSGWGQQLGDFVNLPITNLANSGQYAKGLYGTAFPGVMKYGKGGDIVLIECGYNDRSYSTREEMVETVKAMIAEARANYMYPILVTPNASKHDYKPSVVWSSYLRDVAIDTNCELIDLSQMSYDFLYNLYGDDEDDVVTKNYNLTEVGGDTLHSSYAGAYVWASMVAQGLKDWDSHSYDSASLVNTDFSYTFTDTLGNTITAQVK